MLPMICFNVLYLHLEKKLGRVTCQSVNSGYLCEARGDIIFTFFLTRVSNNTLFLDIIF